MDRTRSARFAAVLALGLALASSAVAQAAAPAVAVSEWAYVVVRLPAATYVPAATDSGNSTGGPNTVTHLGAGSYNVLMSGVASPGGVVHVTPMATGPRICSPKAWAPAGLDESIDVRCYSTGGVATDTPFVLTYLSVVGSGGRIGYLRADQSATASYNPAPNHRYNSTGAGKPKVVRAGVGSYSVRFPGLGTAKGNVQVTAVGGGKRICVVQGWGSVGGGTLAAGVLCRDRLGNLVDSEFSFSFTRGAGLKGDGGAPVAYLHADMPGAAFYNPAAARTFTTSVGPTPVQRVGNGRYVVTLNGSPLGGAAVVTGADAAGTRCVVAGIETVTAPQEIKVRCFDDTGNPANGRFTLSYLK